VQAAVAIAVGMLLLLAWTASSQGSSTRIGLLVRPFQGEVLDEDKGWIPGALTFLLQGGLGKIQGVEVVPSELESLRHSDYVITGTLRIAPSEVVCVARISGAGGTSPFREVTVTEKGAKPDLFVLAGKIYSSLKEEVAKAEPVTSWPGSLTFPTLSLFALKYHVEAGLPGAAKKRLSLYHRALSLDPQLIEAWLGLAEEHLRRGEVADAGASVRKALRLKPDHPAGTSLLGSVRWRNGDRDAAEACFRKAALADPLLLDAWMNLGRLLRERGREQEAREVYLSARKAFGVDAGAMPEAVFFAAADDRGSAAGEPPPQPVKQAAPRGSDAAPAPAAAGTRATGSRKSGDETTTKPSDPEEPGSRVASLEKKLAEREREIVKLHAEAAKVEDLEGRLEKANKSGAEADRKRVEAREAQDRESAGASEEARRLKKDLEKKDEELRSLQRDLEALRSTGAEARAAQQRVQELEGRVAELDALRAARSALEAALKDREADLGRLREAAVKAEAGGAKAEVIAKLGRRVAQLSEEVRRQSLELERLRNARSGGAAAQDPPGAQVGGGAAR
jgi:Flp pilus assembly protein TadD